MSYTPEKIRPIRQNCLMSSRDEGINWMEFQEKYDYVIVDTAPLIGGYRDTLL